MKMQALLLRSQDAIFTVAQRATEVRDQAYDRAIRSPVGPIVKRVNAFVNNNATLVFWGGAMFFFCTHPPLFLASFGMGMVAGSMMRYGGSSLKKIDFSALRQMGKGVAFVFNNFIKMETRCFFAGFSPGYHTYNLVQGRLYSGAGGGIKGFEAIEYELNRLCWELAHWIPLLDVSKHPKLFAIAPLPH